MQQAPGFRLIYFVPFFRFGRAVSKPVANQAWTDRRRLPLHQLILQLSTAEAFHALFRLYGERADRFLTLPAMDVTNRPVSGTFRTLVVFPAELIIWKGRPSVEFDATLTSAATRFTELVILRLLGIHFWGRTKVAHIFDGFGVRRHRVRFAAEVRHHIWCLSFRRFRLRLEGASARTFHRTAHDFFSLLFDLVERAIGEAL